MTTLSLSLAQPVPHTATFVCRVTTPADFLCDDAHPRICPGPIIACFGVNDGGPRVKYYDDNDMPYTDRRPPSARRVWVLGDCERCGQRIGPTFIMTEFSHATGIPLSDIEPLHALDGGNGL